MGIRPECGTGNKVMSARDRQASILKQGRVLTMFPQSSTLSNKGATPKPSTVVATRAFFRLPFVARTAYKKRVPVPVPVPVTGGSMSGGPKSYHDVQRTGP